MDEEMEAMPPTLQNILDQQGLKWIFVGGKGGVGKTTSSCSLAIQLAKVRKSVLLLSTDPAHNLSDAFNQKFSKDPTRIDGFENLYAMEIDPDSSLEAMIAEEQNGGNDNPMASMMNEMSMAIPGVDEAMNFAEVMKLVKNMDYEVVVFDTAPTGHTLRFLSFPSVLEKALGKFAEMSGRFGGMFSQLGGLMGMDINKDDMFAKLEVMRETVSEVNAQFQNPDKTTFVCVAIPEFLSLYETERLIQDLTKYNIDTHNIIVNQIVHPRPELHCAQCHARRRIQDKYLHEIRDLYLDFHVIELPLLTREIRGGDGIGTFSELLIEPYVPPTMTE